MARAFDKFRSYYCRTQKYSHAMFYYHPGLPTAEYLFKPVDPEILLELVCRNLHEAD
jgi:hypothetical protein